MTILNLRTKRGLMILGQSLVVLATVCLDDKLGGKLNLNFYIIGYTATLPVLVITWISLVTDGR